MSYQVVTTQQAESEIETAYLWTKNYSPEKAMLWYFDVQEAIESLANFPARCPLAPESVTFGQEIRHLLIGKYRILFHIDDEAVYVTHVRHSAQQTLVPEEAEDHESGNFEK